ncbi:hypothetical protein [Sideroxyarcus emersonii]|uniref:hypothetical protein n=1 Tax=Sideroxyarcus emersonii TaxID=2764705 RepID=UPI001F41CB63|nr:hypothetical protein [Sideroxyarcus emersonii]
MLDATILLHFLQVINAIGFLPDLRMQNLSAKHGQGYIGVEVCRIAARQCQITVKTWRYLLPEHRNRHALSTDLADKRCLLAGAKTLPGLQGNTRTRSSPI